jgi:hypothetical protein
MMRNRFFVFPLALICVISFATTTFAVSSKTINPARRNNTEAKTPDFTVDIYVTAPAQGDKWRFGAEKAILWSADPARVGPTVRVLLMRARQVQTSTGQQAQLVIKDSWPSGGPGYTWKIPENQAPGEYRIVVQSTTVGKSGSSKPFRLVPQPVFKIILPAGNSVWQAGNSYLVRWAYSGEAFGPLALILFCGNGGQVDNIPLNGPNGDGSILYPVPSQAAPGAAVLLLIEKNKDAALADDLIGYRGVSAPLTIIHNKGH